MIKLPEAGTAERSRLIREIAAAMWAPRHDRPFDEVGEYWEGTFLQLAEDALRALERRYASAHAP